MCMFFDAGEGKVYKFNAAGEPAKFSGLNADAITGVAGAPANQDELAVDSSSGPAKGDIYVADGSASGSEVLIFGADGEPRGTLNSGVESSGGAWGLPCGVAVDPAGHVYVGLIGYVDKFTPVAGATPVTDADYTSKLSGVSSMAAVCNIAADAEESLYAATYFGGIITKYPASQFSASEVQATGTQVDELGTTLAVDPLSGDLFADEKADVAQFRSSGALIGRFANSAPGAINESFGIAVNGTSKDVYVSTGEAGMVDVLQLDPSPGSRHWDSDRCDVAGSRAAGRSQPRRRGGDDVHVRIRPR